MSEHADDPTSTGVYVLIIIIVNIRLDKNLT